MRPIIAFRKILHSFCFSFILFSVFFFFSLSFFPLLSLFRNFSVSSIFQKKKKKKNNFAACSELFILLSFSSLFPFALCSATFRFGARKSLCERTNYCHYGMCRHFFRHCCTQKTTEGKIIAREKGEKASALRGPKAQNQTTNCVNSSECEVKLVFPVSVSSAALENNLPKMNLMRENKLTDC